MVDDVLQHVSGHRGVIEDPADNNGIVRRVVVTQDAPGLVLAPAHAGTGHQAVKKTSVEIFEDCLEVVIVSPGGAQKFATAHLADQVGLPDDFMAADVFAIARRVSAVDGPAVHLGQQDVGDGLENGLGGPLEQIREANQEASVAQTDGVVDVSEGKEFDFQFGWGAAGAELCVGFLEKFKKTGTHGEARVARKSRPRTWGFGPRRLANMPNARKSSGSG